MRGGRSRSKVESTNKLRRRAESIVHASPADVSSMTEEETQRLVYELQVHQVELELQNEELREAQFELASSRDRYADLYEFAPIGYLTLDRAGLVLDANLTAATLLGMERSNLLGIAFSDFIAPDSQDAAYLHWQQVFSSEQRQVCELQLCPDKGESLTVRLESTASAGTSDTDPQCRVALVDISDLKHVRDSLITFNEELEQRVQAQVGEIRLMAKAIASLGEGVLITRDHSDWSQSRIEFANLALCRMVGYTAEELIGQSPALLLGDQMDPALCARLDNELDVRNSFRGELVFRTKDGALRDADMFITPLYDTDQQYTHYVTVQRDITEHKAAQRALLEREERLRAIHDAATDVIITIDRKGVVQDCSHAIEQVFGYSVREVIGQNVSMLMPSPYREQHDGYLRRYHDTGQAHIIGTTRDFRALHRDGHTFPISLSVNKVDHLGLVAGIIHDISELRGLQREVLNAAGQVQWQIGQALHDGPQQALAGLSLTARGLALDLARSGSPYEAAAATLAEELKQANRSIRSLATGLVPVRLGRGGLMEALEQLARRAGEDHDPVVEFECPEPIRIDDDYTVDQLYLITQEAVLNAIKHAGAECIRITLDWEGQAVSLRVEDNGAGIDQSVAENAGLGLHIMAYRAATIGATLTVSATETGGTVVNCILDYVDNRPIGL